MNLIKQHIPNFCSVSDPELAAFETLDDLLNIEFVKQFTTFSKFEHFALSESVLFPDYPAHLMAISDEGFSWWVVGTIMNPLGLDLPVWDGGKYMFINEACEVETITSKEGVSSRAGEICVKGKWYKRYERKNR